MERQHAILEDGESTALWAINQPGFMGSIKQLTHCARCGELPPPKRHDEPQKYSHTGRPTMHMICDRCYEELPD